MIASVKQKVKKVYRGDDIQLWHKPAEVSTAQEELWHEFNEPCWCEYFERKEAEEVMLKESDESEKGKQQAEEGGSGDDGESSAKEATVESCESEKRKSKKLLLFNK
ncbi:unnamed protein product [Lactuca saligna]|uniref:Uncharacterized protein n=1 Tax=Lactuca saligna TaxID=75948 RepID=A0AA35V8Q1_LACSI|nr:unnamed protein product [Lactuca saligna]